jgi:hypothetical protein
MIYLPGRGLEAADELVATPDTPGIGAVDEVAQVADELLADHGVALGGFRVKHQQRR